MNIFPAFSATPYLRELGPLGVAFLLGGAVAALRLRLRGSAGRDGLAWVLVVLAPLLCLVVRAIEGDLAKAFGLVGILALVRFRTPMADPGDAVFVLFSVAAGVVVASHGDLLVAIIGVLALGLGAWAAHILLGRTAAIGPASLPTEVRLRCRGEAVDPAEAALRASAESVRLLRADLGAAGSPCDLRYHVVLRDGISVAHLARAVGAIAGVERVSAEGTAEA